MDRPLTFVLWSATRTPADFEILAGQAQRLTRRGRVELAVSSLAERTRSDLPPGGSPWHDYTSCLPALEKFFPHRDLLPFIDQEHVRRNRQLLSQCLAIARQHKLGAAAQFHVPWLLPDDFFMAHPRLRGPRIDHPRRSRREAFAMCIDTPEGRGFYGEMFGQFVREAAGVATDGGGGDGGGRGLCTVHLLTNDAGGGLCWADWQYPGPNGPAHCRHRGVGPRVKGLIDTLRENARAASPADRATIEFDLRGNFSDDELCALGAHNDEHLSTRPQHGAEPRSISIGSHIDNPVLGVFDPVGILQTLDRLRTSLIRRINVSFSANYSRGHELPEVSDRVIELLEAYFAEPAFGLLARTVFLRRMCAKWVGEGHADALLEALHEMHDAFTYRAATVPCFTANYAGVSIRHINRPLVAIPQRLTPEEESYWLPYVFNPTESEARNDYIDFHGGRMTAPRDIDQAGNPRVLPIDRFAARLRDIAGRLERLDGDGAELFRRMGVSLRIYACILRSSDNFYAVQRIRDRHLERFAGEPRVPPKVADWHGDPDLQLLNEFAREELDNTAELIDLLENAGGMGQILTAADPAEEDTFLLGPDLLNQLKRKCQIMRRHWRDGEAYLSTPHK